MLHDLFDVLAFGARTVGWYFGLLAVLNIERDVTTVFKLWIHCLSVDLLSPFDACNVVWPLLVQGYHWYVN